MSYRKTSPLTVTTLRTGASRITLPSGEIGGYVYPEQDDLGRYFRAFISQRGTAHQRPIGEFSRFEDAIESLSQVF